jgi:Bacteriophage protein of unknown function (DUF646).
MSVTTDTRELDEFAEKMALMADDIEFKSMLLNELAARFLRRVKQLTPVESGDLRRNWAVGEKTDNEVIIVNPTSYAEYVENGHRQDVGRYVPKLGKKLVKPWVKGKFFTKKTIAEMERTFPTISDKLLEEYLRRSL